MAATKTFLDTPEKLILIGVFPIILAKKNAEIYTPSIS